MRELVETHYAVRRAIGGRATKESILYVDWLEERALS